MSEASEPAGGGEVLSQSEVDSLLAQVASQAEAGAVVGLQASAPVETGEGALPYDFRHPAFLSPAQMRQLRLRHEGFIRALGARLSIYMRLEFSLQMTKLHAIQYRKFIDSLPKTTHLSLFKAEPLRGIGILNIPPRLGLSIVERLLGGQAQAVTADHDPSEIELALLDQAVQLVLVEWCNNWASVEELTPTLLGHETNGQFMHTASHDAMMLVLAMEARVGDCTEQS